MQDDSASTSPALDTTTKSRELTRSLLSLDLGYSVLNEELMRRSVGVDVDRLDALPDDDDGIDGGSDAEGEEFFETLPQPQHLGRLSAERAGGHAPESGQNVSSQLARHFWPKLLFLRRIRDRGIILPVSPRFAHNL